MIGTIRPLAIVVACTLTTAPVAAEQFLWQTNSQGDDIHVVEVQTHQVVKRLEVGPQPHGIAAADDASVVNVSIEAYKRPDGELLWIDPRTYEIVHRIQLNRVRVRRVAFTPHLVPSPIV